MKIIRTPQQTVKRAVIISIAAVILLTAAAAVVSYLIASGSNKSASDTSGTGKPMYETSALILVTNESSSPIASSDKVSVSDITDSVVLCNTFATILQEDPDMKAIIASSDVSISPVEDSYFIRITATSDDPHAAANTANQIAATAPQIYKKYFEFGKVGTVEYAEIPSSPVSPEEPQADQADVLPTVIIAALSALCLGMLLSVILIPMIYMSHKKKYASAVKNYFDVQE